MLIKTNKAEFESYLTDASNYRSGAEKLYIPENKDELQELIKELYKENIPFTISGARTGLTGSACPDDGVIISLEKLNEIILCNDKNKSIDKDSKIVSVGAGVIHKDLDNYLHELDLFFPPNPTEANSMIGGNLGTNASGSRTFKYGATRNYVKSLKLFLSNGDEVQIKRNQILENNGKLNFSSIDNKFYSLDIEDIGMPNIKHAAGYFIKKDMDLIDLFIGMEGSLGVIYETELEVFTSPQCLLGLIVFFDNNLDMIDFVEDIRDLSLKNNTMNSKGDISARLIEYFDNYSLDLLRNKYPQIDNRVLAAIWVEQEYIPIDEDNLLEKWIDKINKYSNLKDETWTAMNDKEHKKFAEFRHTLPVQVYEHLSVDNEKIGTDTAVPVSEFRNYYFALYENLELLGLPYLIFGHIGNSHLHANIFYNNEIEFKKAKDFYMDLIKNTIELGGTVSAEHGIGKLKKVYLLEMFGDKIEIMKKIKKVLDPKNLLGKGNLFDL